MADPIQYDSAWKEALHVFLEPAFAFFFPHIHAQIDWTYKAQWLDKELDTLTPDSERGPQIVDILLEMRRTTGKPALVVIHIEVQSQKDQSFAERMLLYYMRLYLIYRRPIASLAILADPSPNWKPHHFSAELFGSQIDLEFPTTKIRSRDLKALATDPNPFAAVVLAHRAAQRTQGNDAKRKSAKYALLRQLLGSGYSSADVKELLRLIDRFMKLPPDVNKETWQKVVAAKGDKPMAYMSYIEEQGYTKGRVEALHASIARLLERKFGEAGKGVVPDIERISDADVLTTLVAEIGAAATLDDARTALRAMTNA